MTDYWQTSLYACEQAVLGAILWDNTQLAACALAESDFLDGTHRRIFEMCRRLIGAREPCDALTVGEAIEREAGGSNWVIYAAKLVTETASTRNAPAYAARLKEESRSRAAIAIAERLQSEPTQEQIDLAIRELMALQRTEKGWTCHLSEAIGLAQQGLMDVADGKIKPGIPTGMCDIDESIGGLHDSDLIVVAARPAMGKTAWMLNSALAADRPVGLFSGEQGKQQIGLRVLSIDGPISLHRMRLGTLDKGEWDRVTTVAGIAKKRPIWIFDRPAPSIDDIERQARAWKFERNIGIIYVDYLQKIRGGKGESFRLQVGDICTRLKDLARELDIPVVALAQVKREVETRPMGSDGLGRMPYMGDIAEAAIIEQEADQIITLYRPEVYDEQPSYKGVAYANICKNRHGPIGHKAIAWRGEYLQFGDLARTEMSYGDRWSAAS